MFDLRLILLGLLQWLQRFCREGYFLASALHGGFEPLGMETDFWESRFKMEVGSSHVRLTVESVLNRVWQGVD